MHYRDERRATAFSRVPARVPAREIYDLVFLTRKRALRSIARRSRDASKRPAAAAGVRQVRFHALRHTFATRLKASGQPMRTIQAFLGHADSKTTQIYAHYAPPEREVEMINQAFAPDDGERNGERTEPN